MVGTGLYALVDLRRLGVFAARSTLGMECACLNPAIHARSTTLYLYLQQSHVLRSRVTIYWYNAVTIHPTHSQKLQRMRK